MMLEINEVPAKLIRGPDGQPVQIIAGFEVNGDLDSPCLAWFMNRADAELFMKAKAWEKRWLEKGFAPAEIRAVVTDSVPPMVLGGEYVSAELTAMEKLRQQAQEVGEIFHGCEHVGSYGPVAETDVQPDVVIDTDPSTNPHDKYAK